jgi:hypothetical protein
MLIFKRRVERRKRFPAARGGREFRYRARNQCVLQIAHLPGLVLQSFKLLTSIDSAQAAVETSRREMAGSAISESRRSKSTNELPRSASAIFCRFTCAAEPGNRSGSRSRTPRWQRRAIRAGFY